MNRRLFACALLALSGLLSGSPATAATTSQPALPSTPGDHRLFFKTRIGPAERNVAYSIYLPKGYEDPGKRWPMFVFLVGAGEAGNNHELIYVHGPAAELRRNKELADQADYMVLTPQCPSGLRWDTPGAAGMVMEVIDFAKKNWRVDPDRIYLTGLSMGGAGTYLVTLEAKGALAAIAPISAVEVQPDKLAAATRGTTTVWIICGADDGQYTTGSRSMADKLRKLNVDTVLTVVPGRGHDIWANYYASRLFYEFLMLHRRGAKPPANRPTPEQLLAIAYTDPKSTDGRLAEPFKKFLPYWQLLNCGGEGPPGPVAKLAGRSDVFVTAPLDNITPCRMITTIDVPAKKHTTLELTVGARPASRWELIVRGNEQEVFKRTISAGPATRPDGAGAVAWQDVSVDLTRFAGQSVRIQLIDAAAGSAASQPAAGAKPGATPPPAGEAVVPAYWAKIKVVSRNTSTALNDAADFLLRPGVLFSVLAVAAAGGALLVARHVRHRGASGSPPAGAAG